MELRGFVASCFLKLFSVLKNKENKKNMENTIGSQFYFILKNTKNIKNTNNIKEK